MKQQRLVPGFNPSSAHDASYPRPQLRRHHWQNLNGPWKFAFDPAGTLNHPTEIKRWTHTIEVPFCPESKASGIGDTGFHSHCWYQREFDVNPPKGRLLLHFGAVDYQARVWVNNQYVGGHTGGHTPFTIDITDALISEAPQILTVLAIDDPHDLAKPRGKQDWQLEPHSIWYPRTSGIWQTVWLETVANTYFGRLRWTPHFERWEIGFETFLKGAESDDLVVKVRLSIDDVLLVNDSYTVLNHEVHRRIALSDPGIDDFRNEILWSPEKPTLIDASVQLWQGDVLLDNVHSYTAMRTVSVQRDRFMLNGRPYYLRLVLDQGYWPDTLMTPPSDEALRTDVQLVKEMGFNGVRKHQKIEDPRFLYWADKLGLLVWEEMPSAYRFTNSSVQRLIKEWNEVIERDSSHPCIVVWVPINESWGVPNLTEASAHRHFVQTMYHLTKSLDPTRPVIGNDGWENSATDMIGIHDYDNDPVTLAKRYGPEVKVHDLFEVSRPGGRVLTLDDYKHQGQPLLLTEFGGIAYAKKPDSTDDEKSWGYARSGTVFDLQNRYVSLLRTVHRIEMFTGFCYTQFTDTFQEANGLLYMDRTPKFPLSVMKKVTWLGIEEKNEEAQVPQYHGDWNQIVAHPKADGESLQGEL